MKNKKTQMSTAGKVVLFASLLIVYILLSYLYPMSQDDYEFAGKYLGDTFRGFLSVIEYFGNGRYLGNGIVLFLMHSTVLRVVVKAFVMAGTVMVLPKAANCESTASYFCSALLVMCMPVEMASQGVVYTAGFNNYMPPVFLFATAIWICRVITRIFEKKPYIGALLYSCLAVIAIAAQLYSENSTVIFVFAAFLLLFDKKLAVGTRIVLLFSTLVGAFGIFMTPKMLNIVKYNGTYRKYLWEEPDTLLDNMLENFHEVIGILSTCTVFFAVFSVIMICVFFRNKKKSPFAVFPLFYMALYPLFVIYGNYMDNDNLITENMYAAAFIGYAVFAVVSAVFVLEKNSRTKVIFCILCAAASCAPLLVIRPIGSRCSVVTYFFLCAACIVACERFASMGKSLAPNVTVAIVALLGFAVAMCIDFYVFYNMHNAWVKRDAYIRECIAAGQDRVEYSPLPYEDWMFNPLHGEALSFTHYYYRNVPGDVKFVRK